ncbi:MAG: DNA primase [Sphingomonadales bacterium]
MRFPPEFLDELRQRVSLVDVVGRKVRLVKKGREHSGLCPFHSEKTPSFTVSEEKGFYHCFGCGAHGDVIRFLTEGEGFHFSEAVERLASDAGITLPEVTPEEKEVYKRRATLYDVTEAAAHWYMSQLNSIGGKEAKEYILERGLNAETIENFKIGYAPSGRTSLKDALSPRKYSEDMLVEAGMLVRPERGPTYDRFQNRVMFPISDIRGKIIAFGGRALEKGAKAKYLNSPATPLFHKGHNLYNAFDARRSAFEVGDVIVTEGYMDVIALAEGGFKNAVAPLGTALTEEQIGLLWRMAAEPILCFDGDKAGFKAASRALDRALPILKPGLSLSFALMPEGDDPDTLIRREGHIAMKTVLNSALPLVEMFWRLNTEGVDISTPERRAGLEKKLFTELLNIKEEKVRGFYMSDIRERLFNLFRGTRKFTSNNKGHKNGFRTNKVVSSVGGLKNTRRGRGKGEKAVKAFLEELIILTIVNHPQLLISNLEVFSEIEMETLELDKLRKNIIDSVNDGVPLEAGKLKHHLFETGFENVYLRITSSDSLKSDWSANKKANLADAELAWNHIIARLHKFSLEKEKKALEEALAKNYTEQGFERLKFLLNEIETTLGDESDIEGYGLASGKTLI